MFNQPPPSETPEMTDHKHESVGVFSRGPCDAPRVSICACGATQKVGSGTWTVPPNPRSFDVLPPEQRAELLAFSEWLKLPKPKMTFEVYRAEHLPPPSETTMTDSIDEGSPTWAEALRKGLAGYEPIRRSPPSETKLSEAIDELIRLTRNQMYVDKDYGRTPDGQETQALILRNIARSSLESLYREQMIRIEDLERQLQKRSGVDQEGSTTSSQSTTKGK